MLSRWLIVAAILLCANTCLAQDEPPVQQDPIGIEKFEGELVVEFRRKTIEFNPRRVLFSEGVKATYGVTTVFSDELSIFLEEGENYAIARGNVRLEDPEGTIEASELTFNWVEGTGRAMNITAMVHGFVLQAAVANITPDRWDFETVLLSGCEIPGLPPPSVRASSITVQPGQRILLRQPAIRLGDATLITLPRYSVSLDPRARGVTFPTITYRQGGGFGVSWNPEILLDNRTLASFSGTIYERDRPSFSAEVARTFLPPPGPTRPGQPEPPPPLPLRPRSELEQRFNFAYFESVAIRTPEQEERYLSGRRRTLAVGTFWNETPQDRSVDRQYNKPFQIAYEHGGRFGDFVGTTWTRFHHIDEIGGPSRTRFTTEASILPPSVRLAPALRSFTRIDVAGFHEFDNFYGWLRGQIGVIHEPNRQFRLAGAISTLADTGRPTFLLDRPPARHALHLRADLILGPRTVSFLAGYDLERRRWYDREIFFAQVVGCFEPYIIWRHGLRDTQIGVRLRLDELLERLQRRDFRRNVPVPP